MARVLVLRPEPGASATLGKARALGMDAVAIPLFRIEAAPWEPPDPDSFDGLLLTSANALRFGGKELSRLRGLPVYAVGEATAEAAREAGFDVASTGVAGVDHLLHWIEPKLKLLHLCGADRREPQGARESITPVVVYRAVETPMPDINVRRAVALIHSPRAGQRFAELVTERGSISIAGISAAASNAVGDGWKIVEVADAPNDEALLALAARLCNKPDPE
jgi:uroporphyrinogen-III synthase